MSRETILMSRKTFLGTAGAVALSAPVLAGCSGDSSGDPADFPSDEITFVVPYPAGNAPDASARVIAKQLEEDFEVSIVVENVEGGGGTLGLYEMSQSDPDGYTIGLGTSSSMSITPRVIDTAFPGSEAVTPISRLSVPASGLFTKPGTWDSIDDFIADAKSRPGEITVGIPNPGSIQDIEMKLLEDAAGIDVEPVYFDAGQQVLPVVNGTVDAAIAQAGPVVQYVDTDKLQWVGFYGDDVPPGVDAPLFLDSGYDTSTFSSYEGIFGPADIPEEIVQKLSDAVGAATESDEYVQYAEDTFSVISYQPTDEFAQAANDIDDAAPGIIDEMGLDE